MFIQCSGDILHSYSTQASKLSFVVVHRNLGVPYVLMASVWNVIRLDGSFSCHSCPGSVRCSDYHPPQTILTGWIESTSVSLQQKVSRDSTWQWKILAGQLYVCLIDSSSVLHLCGWEWPCGSICALRFRLTSFGILSFDCGLICIKVSKKCLKTFQELLLLRQKRLNASLLCSTLLNSVKRLNDNMLVL